jgi:peptidoglycan glycosyltransferase
MNKYLRQLFTAVIALFVVLGMSTTIITAIRANSLSSDPRNARALYQEYGAPRGAILASDGTILAQSTPVNDVFSYQRSYTNGPVYAPVTGFFSVTQRGDRGIESSRNKLLSGKADALFWDQLKSLFTGVENKGASIETSINPKLQQLAYQQLGSNDGAAVVIEVKTGRILTLASAPSYDPNALATHDTKKATANYSKLAAQANSPMINRATSQLYPPGSTFKTIVAATALESGDYDTDTQIPAGASYTLPGTSTNLTNTTAAANGIDSKITLQDALTYSSNTAFAQLGVKLGQDKIAEQAKKLGYGSSITIDGDRKTFDYALILIHGTPGENGRLQGYLDMMEIPYSSCSMTSSVVTFDKITTKRTVAEFGIPLARGFFFSRDSRIDPKEIVRTLGLPVFVKPMPAAVRSA